MRQPKLHLAAVALLLVTVWGLLPLPALAEDRLKVITYNLHGGHGNPEYNLQLFSEMLQGDEHVLCLQEIKPEFWQTVQETFAQFPHRQIVWRQTTDELKLFESRQREANAILSKLPFVWQSERLVQIDPGGDLWERKAGFVGLRAEEGRELDVGLGCYHNTYNFDADDFAAEQQGLRRFRDLALEEFELTSLGSSAPYVLAGDFNLFESHVLEHLAEAPFHFGVWRDHVVSNIAMVDAYRLETTRLDISDHDALVVVLDLAVAEPLPDESPATDAPRPNAAGGANALLLLALWVFCSIVPRLNAERAAFGR